MSSISSIVLKNVVDELQKNVQSEMNKFQMQIGALDSILRHTEMIPSEPTPTPTPSANDIGISLRLSNLQIENKDFDRRLTSLQESFNAKCEEVDAFKKIVESMQDKFTQLLEMSTKLSIDFNNHYVQNEESHIVLDSKMDILNNRCDEIIKNKTMIEMEEFVKAPHNTPESSTIAEPDIVDNVDLVEEQDGNAPEGDVVEEDAEEQEMELDEIEYKGKTYYIDTDNIAYVLDDEGELEEDPVGQWVPEKKIMRFYKK